MKRLLAVALIAAACGGSTDSRVVVGAGTTLVDSGFIEAVVAIYEEDTGAQVSIIGESSQRLLDLGRRGEAELLLTHEAVALDEFIDEGFAARSRPVFASDFLLVGPPVVTLGVDSFEGAFAEIAEKGLSFVSRADGSGTYRQEQIIWELAGINPGAQGWYNTTGQGMGLTLQVASQRGAFVLVETGTWATVGPALDLEVVPLTDAWPNPYFVTLVEGSGSDAAALHDWLTSDDGAAAIAAANETIFGRELYRQFSP